MHMSLDLRAVLNWLDRFVRLGDRNNSGLKIMPQPPEKFSIAMMPLGPSPKILPKAIKSDLSSTWPDLPPIGPTEKSDKKILTFDVGEVFIATDHCSEEFGPLLLFCFAKCNL